MDGDLAPLADIIELAQRHGARVMVDEAHATGVSDRAGEDSSPRSALEREVDVVVGTLGKALGSYGAFACCDRTMAEFLVNRARTLIYSTAFPPPSVAAALAATANRPPRASPSSSACSATPACSGASSPAEGSPCPLARCRSSRSSSATRVRRRRCLQRGTQQRGVRPGHPTAHRPRRHIATARGRDGRPYRDRPPRRSRHARSRT